MLRMVLGFSAVAILACLAIGVHAEEKSPRDSYWDMTQIRKVPLDVQVISSRVDHGYRVEELYFTSEMTPDGPNRIFCGFARPEDISRRVPLMLMLHGGGGHADAGGALFTAKKYGAAALSVDWNGQYVKGPKLVTQWRSKHANLGVLVSGTDHDESSPSGDIHDDPTYHIITAIRRALDFAATQPGIDMKRVVSTGGSAGGYFSMLLAGVDSRVGCVMSGFGAGGWRNSHSPVNWFQRMPETQRATALDLFDPISYASTTQAAVLMIAASNDYFFWLDAVEENYKSLAGFKRILIQPNSNHGLGCPASLPDVSGEWLKRYFEGKLNWPEIVPGSFKAEGRTCSWRARGASPITRGALYWSPGKPVCTARYWIEIPAKLVGDLWTAQLPAAHAGQAGKVFATVFDKDGWPASTPGMERAGADPWASAKPLWADGTLWDVARGAAAWRPGGFIQQRIESPVPGTLRTAPGAGTTTMTVLTDSAILGKERAKSFSGLRFKVNGGGKGGKLSVRLLRDTFSGTEAAYRAEVDFSAGEKSVKLPWKAFKGPEKSPPLPGSIDGLSFVSDRPGRLPLTFSAIELYH